MPFSSRPLLAHHHRALAAAAGLVGRPRLAAGLALTLACACGPLTDDSTDTGVDPSSSADATTTGATGSVGSSSTSSDDAGHSSGPTSDATLLTDASTTLASTGEAPTSTSTSTSTDTGDTTGTGTTAELDDCFINTRTMEVDWDCCEQQNWLPSPQCTPWGPPAPPVAGARMQAARQARQVLA